METLLKIISAIAQILGFAQWAERLLRTQPVAEVQREKDVIDVQAKQKADAAAPIKPIDDVLDELSKP